MLEMSTIEIRLANEPNKYCFAFSPGDKIHIQIKFLKQIPARYRLQILDNRNNSRLNQYGKGSNHGIKLDWKIPPNIRNEHLGTWKIRLNDHQRNILILNFIFYVENNLRVEPLMLHPGTPLLVLDYYDAQILSYVQTNELFVREIDNMIVLDSDLCYYPLGIPIGDKIPTSTSEDVDKILETQIPITAIKGLGKTYAGRLKELEIFYVHQFYIYPDHETLSKTLRVNDEKLQRFLREAEIITQKKEGVIPTPKDKVITKEILIENGLEGIPGIGPKSRDKLKKLGIKTKTELITFKDQDLLRKTLRMSKTRLINLLSSIGKKFDDQNVFIDKYRRDNELESIPGIGPKSKEKLLKLGIKSKSDLKNYSKFTSIEELRRILRISLIRLNKILESLSESS